MTDQRFSGLPAALGAVCLWGLIPIYFKLLQGLGAVEIVAYRVLWTVPLCLLILPFWSGFSSLLVAARNRRTMLYLLGSSIFIGGNWLIYVIAVNTDHILAASLGYFINPLFTVLLATLFLKEKMSRLQWFAIALAAVGVAILAFQALQTLWISVGLAGCWGLYSLTRRLADVKALPGLTIETALLAPFFLIYLFVIASDGQAYPFGSDLRFDLLLLAAAPITLTPLLLFNTAVKKLDFVTLGIVQYVAPTIQFLIGWLVYGEGLTTAHIICFAFIWTSLALYTREAIRLHRARKLAAAV